MRYIAVSQLKPGMVLALPFYGGNFEVLLTEGTTLAANHIQRINAMGYAGVYISDDLSRDVHVEDVISHELRLRTIRSAKDIIRSAESGEMVEAAQKVSRKEQQRIIAPVIDAVIGNRRQMVDMIDLKPYEDYPYYHAANVVVLSLRLGVELGLSGNQLFELGMAALLHDVGNIFIPKYILNKPGKLTGEEYKIIQKHTEMGFEFLKEHFDISIDACIGALQHHERFDGGGYPNQLKKQKISIYGRIIAITDVYDALVSRRPFRQPMLPPEAIAFLHKNAGGMFDPELVEALARLIAVYPSGFRVELSSGVQCLVVNNYAGSPDRPRLRLISNLASTPMYIDLQNDPVFAGVTVVRLVE